ncbi:pseudouridine synthase [Sphingopyxis yananensis]|uniref:pseudouridine synthase n=1 Tax=Sphingopyxis yananensis TaxID=2886687 RepID=UPI001D12A55D|nr:pseudouridine synthase [Sphingopyxis yananensis]MCC2600913.1 pseudouridine synthase [Sphingopyxis yananensis]
MTTRRPPRPPSDRGSPSGGRSGRTPTGRGTSRADSRAEGRDAPRSDRRFSKQNDAPRGQHSEGGRAERSGGQRPDRAPSRGNPRDGAPSRTGSRDDARSPYRADARSTGRSDNRAPSRRDDRPAHRRTDARVDAGRSDRPNRRRPSDTRGPDTRTLRQESSAKSAPRKAPARPHSNGSDTEVDSEGDLIDGPQRIAKLLARAGVGSRRDVERMIDEGRIALNGELITQPAPLLASLDGLTVDGNPVAKPVSTRLYRFYKPVGCLTAARDPKGRKTIYDVLPEGLPRLMPVGRLDYNTEGLMLLTNDGEFKRKLELPASGVERTYRARAFGDVSQAQLEELVLGVEIDGVRYGKIDANLERRTGRNQWIELTLTEGKNREVRNVLEHLGLQVSRLIRVRYGEFSIDGLEAGQVDVVPRDILFQFRRLLS